MQNNSPLYNYFCIFKLSLVVEDQTGSTTFVAFGNPAERLTDTTVGILSLLEETDRYTIPQFIRTQLIGKTMLFSVNVMQNKQYAEETSFRINSSRILEQKPTSSTQLLLSAPPTSENLPKTAEIKTIEETTEQIPSDLFEEDTPTKHVTQRYRIHTSICS